MALKDITLGQYFPGNSLVHRLDPRTKLISVICLHRGAVSAPSGCVTYGIMLLVLAAGASQISTVPAARPSCGGMKPVVFIMVFTAVLNLFYTPAAHEICSFWVFTISLGGHRAVLSSWWCAS